MTPDTRTPLLPSGPGALQALAAAVEATGSERFGTSLLGYLHETCGAEYCAVFRVDPGAPSELASGSHDGSQTAHARISQYLQRQAWAKDPAMVFARTRLGDGPPLLMRTALNDFEDPELRESVWPRIRDRLVVAGRRHAVSYSISILREAGGAFSDLELGRLGASAELLLSLLAQHAQLRAEGAPVDPLAELPRIEACLARHSALSPRERAVCARILQGLSTQAIATDLGVGAETVKTFRKLAYRRLGIGSERELLTWYLGLQGR